MGEKERAQETAEEAERRLNGLPPGSPIPPAGIAIGDPGVNGNIAEDGNEAAINNLHSNIKNLRTGDGGPDPETAAINNTKSNVKNLADAGGGEPGNPPNPVEAANLNLSKSNINRLADPNAGSPLAEATTVKSSKSNSSE